MPTTRFEAPPKCFCGVAPFRVYVARAEQDPSDMVPVSTRVPKSIRKELSDLAHERSTEERIVPRSDVIRDAIDAYLEQHDDE